MVEPAWKRNTQVRTESSSGCLYARTCTRLITQHHRVCGRQGELKFKYPSFLEDEAPQLLNAPPLKQAPPEGAKPERKYAAPPPATRKEPSPAFTPPRGSGLQLPTPSRSGGGMFSCCCGSRNAREEFHHQVVSVTLTKLEKIAATQTALQQQQDSMAQQLAAFTSRLDRIIGGNAEVAQMLRTDRAAQRSAQLAAQAPAPQSQRLHEPAQAHRAASTTSSDDGVHSDWEAVERRAAGQHGSVPGHVPAASSYRAGGAREKPPPADDAAAIVPYSEDAELSEWEKIEARVNAGADDAKHKASTFDPTNPRFSILAAPPSNTLALADRAT